MFRGGGGGGGDEGAGKTWDPEDRRPKKKSKNAGFKQAMHHTIPWVFSSYIFQDHGLLFHGQNFSLVDQKSIMQGHIVSFH